MEDSQHRKSHRWSAKTIGLRPSLPQAADAIALVKKTMHNFIVSVEHKNMGHFRETISQHWKKHHTTEQFNEGYKQIVESGAHLSVLENMEPVFSSDATIGENEYWYLRVLRHAQRPAAA